MTNDFSRRSVLGGTLAASAAAVLSGCGPGSSASLSRKPSKPSPTPAPVAATAPAPAPTPTPTPTPATTAGLTADQMNKATYAGLLFNASSPWNQPIPSTAKADPNSDNMIGNLGTAFSSHVLSVNTDATRYAIPIYYADATTPKVTVRDSSGWWDESGFTAVPMPPQATPDPGSDGHLVVWDVPNATLYEYWKMVKNSDGTWSSGLGAKFSATGYGYQTGIWQGSARAYGGSLAAGAIRYSEMKNGVIPQRFFCTN